MNSQPTPTTYKLNTIYFYLTEGCNLACRHCWIAPKFQDGKKIYPSLSFELFKSIIEQAKPLGLSSVKLTGGEPLLHPQIGAMLDYIKQQDLRLAVETNGILCTPELSDKMKQCKGAFVSVSLDGVDAATHEWVRGVEGSFEKTLVGIHNLVQAGLKPQIIMSIMRRNYNQMEPMVRLSESLGAESVKFNLVQPTARGEQMHESGEALVIDELVAIGKWVENELMSSTRLRIIYSHPAAFRPLRKFFSTNKNDGCGACGIRGIIGVLADGRYALCGIGESVPELVFGSAEKDRLSDVWNNTPILNEIREGLPHRFEGICGACFMKNRCLGYCLAQNYYRKKSLWSPFWYCDMAHEKKLFPASRTN